MRESNLAKAAFRQRDIARLAVEDPHQGSFSKVIWKKDSQSRDLVLKLYAVQERADVRHHYHREVSALLACSETTATKYLPDIVPEMCLDDAQDHPLLELHERKRFSGWSVLTMRAGFSTVKKLLVHILTPVSAQVVGYRLALALAELHAVGVSHQDLKLENVLLAQRDVQDDPLPPLGSILNSNAQTCVESDVPMLLSDDEWLFGHTAIRLIDFGFSVFHSGANDSDFIKFSRSLPKGDFRLPGELVPLQTRDPARLMFYQHVGHVTRTKRRDIFTGTPVASSPERLNGNHKLFSPEKYHRACTQDDVWALGVCIFELMFARSPQEWFEKQYIAEFPRGLKFADFRQLAPNTGLLALSLCESLDMSTDWKDLFAGVFQNDPSLRWTARQVVESKALSRIHLWHQPTISPII